MQGVADPASEEERRRVRVIVAFLAVAALVALAGAWVYSLPSLSSLPRSTAAPSASPRP